MPLIINSLAPLALGEVYSASFAGFLNSVIAQAVGIGLPARSGEQQRVRDRIPVASGIVCGDGGKDLTDQIQLLRPQRETQD